MNKKQLINFIFIVFGIGTLIYLINEAGLSAILTNIRALGFWILLLIPFYFTFPIINACTLSLLISKKVPLFPLIKIQTLGFVYDQLIPFGGFGGTPHRINQLTKWLSIEEATETLLRNRLILTIGGSLYTIVMLSLLVWFLGVDSEFIVPILSVLALATWNVLIPTVLILSQKPTKFLGWLFKKIGREQEFVITTLSVSLLCQAVALTFTTFGIAWIGTYATFLLLDVPPSLFGIIAIESFSAVINTFLFMIPGGIGVFEAGMSGAFLLMGSTVEVALTFAIVGRINQLVFFTIVLVGGALQGLNLKKLSKEVDKK